MMQGLAEAGVTDSQSTHEQGQETPHERREGHEPSKRQSPDRGDIR